MKCEHLHTHKIRINEKWSYLCRTCLFDLIRFTRIENQALGRPNWYTYFQTDNLVCLRLQKEGEYASTNVLYPIILGLSVVFDYDDIWFQRFVWAVELLSTETELVPRYHSTNESQWGSLLFSRFMNHEDPNDVLYELLSEEKGVSIEVKRIYGMSNAPPLRKLTGISRSLSLK